MVPAGRRVRSSQTRRDLPIPASPTIVTTRPRPARASSAALRRAANSVSRPTNVESPAPEATPNPRPGGQVVGALADRPRPRLGQRLQARGQVHGVSLGGVVHAEVVPDLADDHEPRIHADPEGDPLAAAPLKLVADLPHGLLDRQRRFHRARRVVLQGEGRAEQGHDPVAGELVHRALVPVDLRQHHLEEAIHQVVELLRVELLGEAGEVLEVGEEDGDLLALALQRRPGREDALGQVLGRVGAGRVELGRGGRVPARGGCRDRGPALIAELRPLAEGALATRAPGGEGGAALVAEPGAFAQIVPTARAIHGGGILAPPARSLKSLCPRPPRAYDGRQMGKRLVSVAALVLLGALPALAQQPAAGDPSRPLPPPPPPAPAPPRPPRPRPCRRATPSARRARRTRTRPRGIPLARRA